jgi:hypothetical protein
MKHMTDITQSWTNFKSAVNSKSLTIQYTQTVDFYYLVAFLTSNLQITCIIYLNNGSDQIDFETNYKPTASII